MQSRRSIRPWIEAALLTSLAATLSTIAVFRMPLGGSVTPGASVAICVAALRNGPLIGAYSGFGYGILNFLLGGAFLGLGPFVFDYLLSGTVLGVCGFFRKMPLLAVAVGQALRAACHILSGVAFFSQGKPYLEALNYSLAYNASYLIPDMLIGMVLFYRLIRDLPETKEEKKIPR